MALKLKNRWDYIEKDWWDWEAFIDGSQQELDEVSMVEYILHPTFIDPVRKIKSRSNKFLMQTDGWGSFKLKAYVNKKDGTIVKLVHDIVLKRKPPKGESD